MKAGSDAIMLLNRLPVLESMKAGSDAIMLLNRLPVLESMKAGGDANDVAQLKCRLPTYNS